MKRYVVAVSAAVALLGVPASAIFVRPDVEDVPVDRIVANLSRQIAATPDDAGLHARLARVHAIAYAQKTETFPAERGGAEPWFSPSVTPPIVAGPPAQGPAAARSREHLAEAVSHYRDAVRLAPGDAVARLGYAWTLDQSGDRAAAVREYRAVIERAWPKERELKMLPPFVQSLAVEAGGYLEKLLDPVEDKAEIDALHQRRQQIARLPRAVTPIAVPLRDEVAWDRIGDPGAAVLFDADGSGIARRWTWITPDAAWLVYDPRATGHVRSALQLFGSVTFWMFWHDGYEALAALDDDGDGSLKGVELKGLALWHDRDADGVSDPGEVRSLADHGIVALGCRGSRGDAGRGIAAYAVDGVTLATGVRRPTFDVILRSPSSLTN